MLITSMDHLSAVADLRGAEGAWPPWTISRAIQTCMSQKFPITLSISVENQYILMQFFTE